MMHLLADHPHLINAVALMRWREWGQEDNLRRWISITVREAGRDQLPVTWVAVDERGEALGAVAIGDHEDVRPQVSPWVWGLVVRKDARRQGVGRQLLDRLSRFAVAKGHPEIWVATGGPAVSFYERCGFRQVEQATNATILVKPLSAETAEPPSVPA
jgi:GNAT superfamily N-acetyltransferase